MKLYKLVLLLSLAAMTMFIGCSNTEDGSTLKIAVDTLPNLALYASATNDITDAQSVIFDSLIYVSKDDFAIKPMLAESWSNPDALTWVFNLRQGVLFQDDNAIFPKGEAREMNAEDVVYSINYLIENSTSWSLGPISEVSALDEYTVEIRTETPQPFLMQDPNRLGRVLIMPKDAVEIVGEEEFAMNPVGTGPFKVTSFAPDSGLLLSKNENYWLPVNLDQVEFVVIPDPTSQTLALQSGEVDVVKFIMNHEMIKTLEADSNVTILNGRGGSYRGLGFNVTVSPYDNKEVRQAISMLMDIDTAISPMEGYSQRAYGQVPPWVPFGFDPSLADLWEYNPEKGRQLLESNGFEDVDDDGLYEFNGEPFSIDINTPSGSHVQVLTILATQLRQNGIDANIQTEDIAVWADRLVNLDGTTLFFDYSFAGTTGMQSLFQGDMVGRSNTHGYKNAEVDNLLTIANTKTDPEELSSYWKEAQRQIFSDYAGIPLYFESSYAAVRSDVEDFVPPWGGLRLVSTENNVRINR